jgi:hypothetical protein
VLATVDDIEAGHGQHLRSNNKSSAAMTQTVEAGGIAHAYSRQEGEDAGNSKHMLPHMLQTQAVYSCQQQAH